MKTDADRFEEQCVDEGIEPEELIELSDISMEEKMKIYQGRNVQPQYEDWGIWDKYINMTREDQMEFEGTKAFQDLMRAYTKKTNELKGAALAVFCNPNREQDWRRILMRVQLRIHHDKTK
jgi:hypothetical protein